MGKELRRISAGLHRWLIHVWLNRIEQIKILIAIAVGIFALWEYYDRKDTASVERTIEHITRYRDQDYLAAFNDIIGIMLSPEISHLRDMDEVSAFLSKRIRENDSSLAHANLLYAKYNDMAFCVIIGQCDAFTMCSSFFWEIQLFDRMYRDFIEFRRGRLVDAGRYFIEKFIGRCNRKDWLFAFE